MSDTLPPRIARFIPMIVVVCLVATFIGFVASAFAGLGYGLSYRFHPPTHSDLDINPVLSTLAVILGTTFSAVAGVAWSVIMVRSARQGADRFVPAGVRWGIALGILATFIMHGGLVLAILYAAPAKINPGVFIYLGIGIFCAVVAGLVLGALGGWLCELAARRPETLENSEAVTDQESARTWEAK